MTTFAIRHLDGRLVHVQRRVYKDFLRNFCVRNGTPFRVLTKYAGHHAHKTLVVLG